MLLGRIAAGRVLLLVGEHLGRFKIDAVQRVDIKNDLLAPPIGFGVDDAAVGYAAMFQQEILAAGGKAS